MTITVFIDTVLTGFPNRSVPVTVTTMVWEPTGRLRASATQQSATE